LPSECEYLTNNEDRHLISQADAIESLRSEVVRLKQRLADLENTPKVGAAPNIQPHHVDALSPPLSHSSHEAPSTETTDSIEYGDYAALQAIFEVIASAPPHIVTDIVAQVRDGVALETILASAERARRPFVEAEEESAHFEADSRNGGPDMAQNQG
jgi:hypothetical protein